MSEISLSKILRACIGILIIVFTITTGLKMMRSIANAQITHETTLTASVPLWSEVSTSSDTVYVKTNGRVEILNYENNYGNN